jgi:transcriptional regulator with XRE-family HTH domain
MTPAEIKAIRKALGLSAAELGAMLECDAQTVRRMEMSPDAKTFREPAARMVRLLHAYLDGYRPKDWPIEYDDAKAVRDHIQGLIDDAPWKQRSGAASFIDALIKELKSGNLHLSVIRMDFKTHEPLGSRPAKLVRISDTELMIAPIDAWYFPLGRYRVEVWSKGKMAASVDDFIFCGPFEGVKLTLGN